MAQRDASGRDGLRPSRELLVPQAKWGDLVATPRQETTGFEGGERKEGSSEGVWKEAIGEREFKLGRRTGKGKS